MGLCHTGGHRLCGCGSWLVWATVTFSTALYQLLAQDCSPDLCRGSPCSGTSAVLPWVDTSQNLVSPCPERIPLSQVSASQGKGCN